MKIEIEVIDSTVLDILKFYGEDSNEVKWNEVKPMVQMFFLQRGLDALDKGKEA